MIFISSSSSSLSSSSPFNIFPASTRKQLLWHRALHVWGSWERFANSCSQAGIVFFLFVCLFLVFSSSHLLGWKLVIFWMNNWRLYVLRAEHDNTLKQSHFCVLQKYAGCSNSLLPCHVHFRPDWKRVWADQVKSLDFASQTSQICPPQYFMLKVFFLDMWIFALWLPQCYDGLVDIQKKTEL